MPLSERSTHASNLVNGIEIEARATVPKTFPFETQIFWPCERLGWFGFVLVSTTAPRQESRTSIPYDRRNRTHERLTGNWIFREEGFSVCFNAHSVQCIVSQSATTNE